MGKVINTIKLGGKIDLSSIKDLREKQNALGDADTNDNEVDTSEIDRLIAEQLNDPGFLEPMGPPPPPPLSPEEVVYRRSLILKARTWRHEFDKHLGDFPSSFESMNIHDLENVIQEMRFVIATRNSGRFAIQTFETCATIVENLHPDFQGLSQCLISDETTTDIVKELSLEYQSYIYTRAEYRLGMVIIQKLNSVRSANKRKRITGEVLEEKVDLTLIEEFDDL